ncbi:MAG: CBS domain-containing protein [Alphaproteobacteria bacterium]|nr:CBS domain-containing protein [Alphaproteobacteria bacterium]
MKIVSLRNLKSSKENFAFGTETPISEIALALRERKIGAVPIVDQDNKLLGIVSERDIVSKLVVEAKDADLTTAKEIMTSKIITAKLLTMVDSIWKPMAGVEMVLAVKRLDGNLNISETATYTTDTAGLVTGEFKRDSLPGDTKGNLVLVANIIDNDVYGNIIAETSVPWGKPLVYTTNYNHRSLFARRGHSPIWLELLAYGIIILVWGVIIYLGFQIRNIIKLGLD